MWKGSNGYWEMMKNGKQVKVHKYVWELINGQVPDGYELHHGDGKGDFSGEGNKKCNCIANLMLMKKSDHIKLHKTGSHHSNETKVKISTAQTGRIVSDETRQKMSKAQTGKIISDETKLKMKENKNNQGNHHSEEAKKKISEFLMGNKYNLGHKASDETKKKLSEAGKGRKHSEETKLKMSESRKRYLQDKL